jgi:molecular chaperone DnaJ
MKHHPDRNPDNPKAEEHFKEVKEAYEFSPTRRSARPTTSTVTPAVDPQSGMGGSGPGDSPTPLAASLTRSSVVRRGGGGRSNIYRGADLRYNLEVTLEQAAFGTETKIRIPTMEVCDACHGSGAKAGTQPKTCPTCQGSGQVRLQQGFFSIQQTCPKCHGTGAFIADPCVPCQGAGRVKQHKTLAVKIPGRGRRGRSDSTLGRRRARHQWRTVGDLYVQIHLKAHPVFQREQNDLHCEMPISFTTARWVEKSIFRRSMARRKSGSPGDAVRENLSLARQRHQGRA